MSEWFTPPWDAIAFILAVAGVSYLGERLFVWVMMRGWRRALARPGDRGEG